MAANQMSICSFNPQSIWSQGMYHSSMGMPGFDGSHSASPDRWNKDNFIIILDRVVIRDESLIDNHLDDFNKLECFIISGTTPGQPVDQLAHVAHSSRQSNIFLRTTNFAS